MFRVTHRHHREPNTAQAASGFAYVEGCWMCSCWTLSGSVCWHLPQHVSGDTPPIIRSLILHRQPLVLHTWKVVGRAVVGHCHVAYATWHLPQHVSGDTPPIIRSLILHRQPLVLHTWKVVGCAVVGHCQVAYATWQCPTTARLTTFHVCKTRGCLCSIRLPMIGGVSPETCWAPLKIRNNKILIHCCILLGFSL